jgi:hypothetical protein
LPEPRLDRPLLEDEDVLRSERRDQADPEQDAVDCRRDDGPYRHGTYLPSGVSGTGEAPEAAALGQPPVVTVVPS